MSTDTDDYSLAAFDIGNFNRASVNQAAENEELKKENKKLQALAEKYRQREFRNRKKVEVYKEKFAEMKRDLKKVLGQAGRFAKKPSAPPTKKEIKTKVQETLEERLTRVYGPLKETT